jgi:uncharacterized protein YciI
MPHFLCKLVPPRPTFLADMSAEEALTMRRHREYWTPRVESGVVVAMGPVADPAGAYGIAIIEARSEAALEAMLESDPAILSKTGFSYEVFGMPAIAVRPSLPLAPVDSVTP